MATRKRGFGVYTAEAVVMLLVGGLVFVAGLAGWLVGHYGTSGSTKTVTAAAAGTAATTAAGTTTAASPTTTAAATTTTAAATTTARATTTAAAAAGNAQAGKAIFASNCSPCHGATGHGGAGGPDLTSIPSAKQLPVVLHQVENGGAVMPPFKGRLSQTQINDVATYVVQDITHGSTK